MMNEAERIWAHVEEALKAGTEEARREALGKIRQALKLADACDVCAGEGIPASGLRCICNGAGSISIAVIEMRTLLYDTEKEKGAMERAVSVINGVRNRMANCMNAILSGLTLTEEQQARLQPSIEDFWAADESAQEAFKHAKYTPELAMLTVLKEENQRYRGWATRIWAARVAMKNDAVVQVLDEMDTYHRRQETTL